MHSETMDIKEFASDKDAKAAGYDIPLTRSQAKSRKRVKLATHRMKVRARRLARA